MDAIVRSAPSRTSRANTALLCVAVAARAFAQGSPQTVSLAAGEKLYAVRCAACHGKDARGGEGPSLYRSRIVVSAPERRFFEVLKNGIPGTEMAPLKLPEEQIWQIVRFVHSETRPGQGPPVAGDVDAGRAVFIQTGCIRCHIVEGKGGVLGPSLSSIALQLTSSQIREAVLDPSARIAETFHGVKITTGNGRMLEGTLKNEDNFSLQIMTLGGELVSITRSDIKSMETPRGSLMPADIAAKLPPADLQNLLAFLDRQRAPFVHTQMGFQNY